MSTLQQDYESGRLRSLSFRPTFPYNARLNDIISIYRSFSSLSTSTIRSFLSLSRGDITTLTVDAIVNAANRTLLGGGGVDGAIHRAAGPDLYDECVLLGGAETGQSKITLGHDLPCSHIIHTVGPIYSSHRPAESQRLLEKCYRSALDLMVANDCRSIAFSSISTGVYGYPLDDATRVAISIVRDYLTSSPGLTIEKVIFTVFRQIDLDSYLSIIPEYFPPPPTTGTENGKVVDDAELQGEEDESIELDMDEIPV